MSDLTSIRARAQAGEAEAQYALGMACHLGQPGARRDLHEAEHWYHAAAAQDHAGAMRQLGVLHVLDWPKAGGTRDDVLALHYFEQAAGKGDAEAMFLAADLLYHAEGEARELARALDWYVKAARAGDGRALHHLGRMALQGAEVPRNPAKAVDCFRRGAQLGHADCEYALARCCLDGEGLAPDFEQGVDWLRKAAAQDHAAAKHDLALLYQSGKLGEPDAATVFQLLSGAAALGDPAALFDLGQCYRHGQGTAVDELAALTCFRQAADLGHVDATFMLAQMLDQGFTGQAGDPALAVHWYTLAASHGHAGAAHNLGMLHAQGKGVMREVDTAKTYFEDAVAGGDDSAMASLGHLLMRGGPGLEPDLIEAYKWALLSASHRPQDGAQALLDMVTPMMYPAQVEEAKTRANAWQRAISPDRGKPESPRVPSC